MHTFKWVCSFDGFANARREVTEVRPIWHRIRKHLRFNSFSKTNSDTVYKQPTPLRPDWVTDDMCWLDTTYLVSPSHIVRLGIFGGYLQGDNRIGHINQAWHEISPLLPLVQTCALIDWQGRCSHVNPIAPPPLQKCGPHLQGCIQHSEETRLMNADRVFILNVAKRRLGLYAHTVLIRSSSAPSHCYSPGRTLSRWSVPLIYDRWSNIWTLCQ